MRKTLFATMAMILLAGCANTTEQLSEPSATATVTYTSYPQNGDVVCEGELGLAVCNVSGFQNVYNFSPFGLEVTHWSQEKRGEDFLMIDKENMIYVKGHSGFDGNYSNEKIYIIQGIDNLYGFVKNNYDESCILKNTQDIGSDDSEREREFAKKNLNKFFVYDTNESDGGFNCSFRDPDLGLSTTNIVKSVERDEYAFAVLSDGCAPGPCNVFDSITFKESIDETNETNTWNTYNHTGLGFSFQYPNNGTISIEASEADRVRIENYVWVDSERDAGEGLRTDEYYIEVFISQDQPEKASLCFDGNDDIQPMDGLPLKKQNNGITVCQGLGSIVGDAGGERYMMLFIKDGSTISIALTTNTPSYAKQFFDGLVIE